MQIEGSPSLRKIVVLNPKGGSGKTTLAFNIAGYIAATGRRVALVDMDPQRSSTFWLQNRPARLPPIYGVAAARPKSGRNQRPDKPIELPTDVEYAVIDAPGAVAPDRLADFTVGSHAILVPVMPSDIDIHAASRLVQDLLLVARVSRVNRRLGVIANRVRRNTLAYRRLMKFLGQLSIAVIGVVRDSQNYVTAAHRGMCIHELPNSKVREDLAQWESITRWLEQRLATPLDERDLRRPEPVSRIPRPARRYAGPVAGAFGLAGIVAIGALLWLPGQSRDAGAIPDGLSAAGVAAAPVPSIAAAAPPAESELQLAALPEVADTVAADVGRAVDVGRTVDVGESGFDAVAAEGPVESPPGPLTAELMREKWQLSGIARAGETNVVLLMDRSDLSTRRAVSNMDIDGWRVAETGSDYAVLRHGAEEVRLQLNELLAED